MSEAQRLWVVVPTSVYDHGVVGVFSSEEAAVEAVARIWPDTDGHHALRVEVLELDRAYQDVFPYKELLGSRNEKSANFRVVVKTDGEAGSW